jgi:hypothetical protein
MNDVQATEEAFSPQKENIQHFKTTHFFTFLFFLWVILDNPDPDSDQNQCGFMRILKRIHNTA